MHSAADLVITCELAWLLIGATLWALVYRPTAGPRSSVFVASIGAIVAWPVALYALVRAQRRGWR